MLVCLELNACMPLKTMGGHAVCAKNNGYGNTVFFGLVEPSHLLKAVGMQSRISLGDATPVPVDYFTTAGEEGTRERSQTSSSGRAI